MVKRYKRSDWKSVSTLKGSIGGRSKQIEWQDPDVYAMMIMLASVRLMIKVPCSPVGAYRRTSRDLQIDF